MNIGETPPIEAARRRKALVEIAERNPGYTPPHREAINRMLLALAYRISA